MRDYYLVLRRRGTSPFIYLFRVATLLKVGPPKLLFPLSQVAGSPSKSPERISLITRTCESCIANLVINPTMSEEVLEIKVPSIILVEAAQQDVAQRDAASVLASRSSICPVLGDGPLQPADVPLQRVHVHID